MQFDEYSEIEIRMRHEVIEAGDGIVQVLESADGCVTLTTNKEYS